MAETKTTPAAPKTVADLEKPAEAPKPVKQASLVDCLKQAKAARELALAEKK